MQLTCGSIPPRLLSEGCIRACGCAARRARVGKKDRGAAVSSRSLHGLCGEEAQGEVFARKGRATADAFAEEHRKAGALVAGADEELVGIPALALRKARKAV